MGAKVKESSARAAVPGKEKAKRMIPNKESEYASPSKQMCKKSRNHRL
eukprot:CAMPEP_0196233660 /NCGR_PEP_ID=MMETSP0913-20130531/3990_1 /TAXON_ID=49265 /ORGANISM="Thalassiosira rotula, Strain GSO102" /LENGTH=47 /DNA_ID= /DNA_START= /DNA_END= /DNA_ORIENTATION=